MFQGGKPARRWYRGWLRRMDFEVFRVIVYFLLFPLTLLMSIVAAFVVGGVASFVVDVLVIVAAIVAASIVDADVVVVDANVVDVFVVVVVDADGAAPALALVVVACDVVPY